MCIRPSRSRRVLRVAASVTAAGLASSTLHAAAPALQRHEVDVHGLSFRLDPASTPLAVSEPDAGDERGRPLALGAFSQDEFGETPPPPPDPADGPRAGWMDERAGDPLGMYARVSGMIVDPRNDALIRDGSGSVTTDTDFGLSVALGFRYAYVPLSFEIEYAYRALDSDPFVDPGTMLLTDSDLDVHTISFNLLYDQPNIIGPLGVYAGAGVGFQIGEFRFTSQSGSSTTQIDGEGFAWQAMAGLTLTFDPRFQLYGGVRWSDADTIDDGPLLVDTESLNYEFGLRFFF